MTLPSRHSPLGTIDTTVTSEQLVETELQKDITPWAMNRGKLTHLLILGEIFVIRDDCPDKLNPIQVAYDFLRAFNIPLTRIARKTIKTEKPESNFQPNLNSRSYVTTNTPEHGDRVDKIYNTYIYRERVIDIYQNLRKEFSSATLIQYFIDAYKKENYDITEGGAQTRSYAYLAYLKKENLIKKTNGMPGIKTKSFMFYEFINAPYGVELIPDEKKIIKAEDIYDPEYGKLQRQQELEKIRNID